MRAVDEKARERCSCRQADSPRLGSSRESPAVSMSTRRFAFTSSLPACRRFSGTLPVALPAYSTRTRHAAQLQPGAAQTCLLYMTLHPRGSVTGRALRQSPQSNQRWQLRSHRRQRGLVMFVRSSLFAARAKNVDTQMQGTGAQLVHIVTTSAAASLPRGSRLATASNNRRWSRGCVSTLLAVCDGMSPKLIVSSSRTVA